MSMAGGWIVRWKKPQVFFIQKVSPLTSIKNKFGTKEEFCQQTLDFLRQNGFLGLGNWSSWKLLRSSNRLLPYMINKDFMASFAKSKGLTVPDQGHTGYKYGCIPVFHPDFAGYCDQFAKDLAETANDPYVLGIYTDNEMPAYLHMLDWQLRLKANNLLEKPIGYDAALAWLKARGKSAKTITDQDREEFIAYVFGEYYRIVSAAIRKYDPHHLYVGSRVHARDTQFNNAALWRVMGQYLDVISVNDYFVWGPDPQEDLRWESWSHKPILISEWYAKSRDVPDMSDTGGAGWIVKTQEDRGKYFQHYMLKCFESGNIVGSQYFTYMERKGSTLNNGLMNAAYEPYTPLVDRARAVNRQVYSLIDFFDHRKGN